MGDETVGVLLVEKRSQGGSHAGNTLVKAAAKTRLGSRHEESRCMSTNTRATNTASHRIASSIIDLQSFELQQYALLIVSDRAERTDTHGVDVIVVPQSSHPWTIV